MTKLRMISISLLSVVALAAGLVAVTVADPAPPGHERRRRPPEAAFAACNNVREGDACSFQGRDRKIEGTCRKPPKQDRRVCRPADKPKQGSGDRTQAPKVQDEVE
jgi:hypothetical protein